MDQKKAGIVLSYVSEIIRILTGLIYTPVMLRLLGQSEYGLYQLAYSVVAYLSLLSLGFGSSYLRFYSRYKAKEDREGVARLNGMFMSIFCGMALVCMLCGAVLLGNIRALFGTGLTEEQYAIAWILMAVMIFNMALSFPNSVFSCYITAHEEFRFQKTLVILQNLLTPFLTLPLLLLGYGSIGMVCITSCLTIGVMLCNIFFCVRRLHMRFGFKGFDFALLKEMWVFTFFIFLNQIIDLVNWNVDKFLLGRMAGVSAVAIYGVGGQINSMYVQFSTSISHVFAPEVNRIVAETDDNQVLTKMFTQVGRIQFMVMTLVLTGFIFLGYPFIKFWAGEEYLEAYYVCLFLITPVTVPLIQNLGIEIQRAKNKHKMRSCTYCVIAVANILLSIPLIRRFGPVGAAMGTAVAFTVGNILFMNWYYHRKIGLDILYFWKNILSFVPALVLPCMVGIIFLYGVSFDNWFFWAMGIVTYILVYLFSMWRWGMNREEKQQFSGVIRKVGQLSKREMERENKEDLKRG